MKFIFAFMLVVLETVGGCLHVYGQTRDTLNVADSVVYDTVAIETGTSENLFKFYSKIILWQRYAAWLRAYRPCIHSQW